MRTQRSAQHRPSAALTQRGFSQPQDCIILRTNRNAFQEPNAPARGCGRALFGHGVAAAAPEGTGKSPGLAQDRANPEGRRAGLALGSAELPRVSFQSLMQEFQMSSLNWMRFQLLPLLVPPLVPKLCLGTHCFETLFRMPVVTVLFLFCQFFVPTTRAA